MFRKKLAPLATFALVTLGAVAVALVTISATAVPATAAPAGQTAVRDSDAAPGFLGVETETLTEALREHFGAPAGIGVLISDVRHASAAERAGLRAGDVIVEIDGEAVEDSSDLRRLIRRAGAGTAVQVAVVRDGSRQTLDATLGETSRRVARANWSGSEDWNEEQWEEFGERMGEFGERMGEFGENFGERFGAHFEAWGEEFGRRMEEWGEGFASRWEGHGHQLSAEERARVAREVEEALANVDFERIGADVEAALGAVDWENLHEEISRSIESAMRALDELEIEWDDEPNDPRE